MSDEKKFDMSESDRVLQQLREHIGGRLEGKEEARPSDALFDSHDGEDAEDVSLDDALLLSEVLESIEQGGAAPDEEPLPVEAEEASAPDDAMSPTEEEASPPTSAEPPYEEEILTVPAEAPTPVEAQGTPTLPEAEAPIEAEVEATPEQTTAPDEATREPTSEEVRGSAKRRRRAKRTPKPTAIKSAIPEAPMLDTALEEKKQRAADLAREQREDLYWRATGEASERDLYKNLAKSEPAPKREAISEGKHVKDHTSREPASEPDPIATAPIRAKATRGEREEIANVTVEGLLQDIFGKTGGPAGHAWVEKTPDDEEPDLDRTVEELVSSATQPVIEGEGGKEETAEPPIEAPLISPDGLTLECDGQRIILPDDDFKVRRTDLSENEERIKLFSAFSAKRMPKNETEMPKPSIKSMSAKRRAFKETLEGSEEDFKLLVDLDYEDELGKVIGFEKIRDYHERRINGQLRLAGDPQRNKRRFEYGSHTQDIDLCKYYARQRKHRIIHFVVVLFLLAFMFVYEHSATIVSLFGTGDGMRYPAAYILLGLVFFGVAVFLFRRPLLEGLLAIFRLGVVDYSFASATVLVTILYHVGLFFAPAGSGMRLYLSPALFVIALIAASELFNCYREFSAFRVVSSKQQKYALLPRISVGGSEGNALLSLSRQREEEAWYVRPIGFVRNYFTNTAKKSERGAYFGVQLLISIALSLLALLFVYLSDGTLTGACHAAFVTFLLTLPTVSVLYTSVPMFFGVLLRLKRKGAIVGEVPVHEMSDKLEVVLSERDCFKGLDHAQFELVKNCDAERSVILIRALLDAIGSPLTESVHVPTRFRLDPAVIALTDVGERGVAAVVREESGNTPILLGDVSYLQKYGIRVSPKKDGRYEEIKRQMLCVAINGKLTALFVAQYRFKDDVEGLLSLLKEEGIGLVIRTKDPGIYGEMIRGLVGDTYRHVRVMKPDAAEMDLRTDRVDASVVSVGSAKEAARTIAACRRIRRAVRGGAVWQTLSLLFGAGLAATLAFFGMLVPFSSFFVTPLALLAPACHALSAFLILRE